MTTKHDAAIVVGVDGSPHSLRALDWAAREAVVGQRPLRIVHAFLWPAMNDLLGRLASGQPDAGPRRAAERILSVAADRARRVASTVDISTHMATDVPAAALIEASRDAGLVVVGQRGLGGFTGLLVGSVGVLAAAHAACPVIVVRDSDPDEAGPAAGEVVVGVDGSELSSLAVGFAFSHAALHRLGVLAVHVYAFPAFIPSGDPLTAAAYDVDDLRDEHARLLVEALAGYRDNYPDVPVRHKVVYGRPAAVLVAESAGAALTVVGSRGRGGFAGLLLGSTSQSVLHHATGPVAIVRQCWDPGRSPHHTRGCR
jgi:nucleotide-binding universal stress UspA family protein